MHTHAHMHTHIERHIHPPDPYTYTCTPCSHLLLTLSPSTHKHGSSPNEHRPKLTGCKTTYTCALLPSHPCVHHPFRTGSEEGSCVLLELQRESKEAARTANHSNWNQARKPRLHPCAQEKGQGSFIDCSWLGQHLQQHAVPWHGAGHSVIYDSPAPLSLAMLGSPPPKFSRGPTPLGQ